MPPDPGKSPQSAQSPPSELFHRSESSDDDPDDEEEDVDPSFSGYQPLSTAASADQVSGTCLDEDGEDEDDISPSRVMEHIRTHMLPHASHDDVPITTPDTTAASDHVVQSFQLSKDDSEKVKSAMSGFKLPASAIPEWAQVVPEENWKSLLDQRIRDKLSPK